MLPVLFSYVTYDLGMSRVEMKINVSFWMYSDLVLR